MKKIVEFLQPIDSLILGALFILPIGILIWLAGMIDKSVAAWWRNVFNLSGTEEYFFVPGTALFLTIACIYGIGRVGKTRWFMKSLGKILARIWVLGDLYKKAVWLMYTRRGFLKPVWVYRNGLLEFDRPGPEGKVVRIFLGQRRRAFFLREVYDDNPKLPKALGLTCELLITPSQLVGGEAETFPFQLVATQEKPGLGAFSGATLTQGLSGYTHMSTLFWNEARKVMKFKELPEKDRELLKGLGIIIENQSTINNKY